jgi:hypothetical protein
VAQITAKALDRLTLAAQDHVREPQGPTAAGTERDLTVNHAFSRQFSEVTPPTPASLHPSRPVRRPAAITGFYTMPRSAVPRRR